jgi:choline-glycine betaine transporter
MNLPRSKLKNAFYILVALALVYVFLINASLNNTIREALLPFTGNSESGSYVTDDSVSYTHLRAHET